MVGEPPASSLSSIFRAHLSYLSLLKAMLVQAIPCVCSWSRTSPSGLPVTLLLLCLQTSLPGPPQLPTAGHLPYPERSPRRPLLTARRELILTHTFPLDFSCLFSCLIRLLVTRPEMTGSLFALFISISQYLITNRSLITSVRPREAKSERGQVGEG